MKNRAETVICQTLIQHHLLFFLGSLLLCFFAAFGLRNLSIDTDPRLYFSNNDIRYQQLLALQEEYGKADTITFVMEFREGDLFSRNNLALLEKFTKEAKKLSYANQVNSLSNYTYSWSRDDELFVDSLVPDANELTDTDITAIRTISLSEPGTAGRMVNSTGKAALVGVVAHIPEEGRTEEILELAEEAHALARRFEQENPQIDILLTGNVINNHAINQAILDDILHITPALCLVTVILIALFLNSWVSVVLIFALAAAAEICTLGIASASGIVLTLLSITSINIIIVIAIAHCVHILYCFLKAYRQGKEKEDALFEALRINLVPVFLTSITTVFGFASLNFSDMPPARDFGNITALGSGLIFLLSLTLLPALILHGKFSREQKRNLLLDWINMKKLSSFVIRYHRMIALFSTVIAISLLLLSTQNTINSRFTENIRQPHPFRMDNEKIDGYFGGFYSIEYSFRAKSGESISSPEYLQALDNLTIWLREQPEVRNVFSYTDVIKRLNRNMHGDAPGHYRIPESQEQAAQYLLLMEMAQPEGSGMEHYVKTDHTATKLVVALPTLDSSRMMQLQQRFEEHIRHTLPGYMHHPGTSLSTVWAGMGNEVARSSIKSAITSLLLIFLFMTVIFRSLRYGLASLVPNVMPMGIGYGIWALYHGELDMNQLSVFCITLGIVVDDTIHFLSKYLRARRSLGMDSENSVHYAFEHVGQPLWITTAVLVTGFGLLMFSGFAPNFNLGFLASVILLSGLALDYLFLPSLLLLMDKEKTCPA